MIEWSLFNRHTEKVVIVKRPYMLLTAAIACVLGLSACSPSATSPSEQEASQSASASAEAEYATLSDQQKAADVVIKYTEAIVAKDAGKACGYMSDQLNKLASLSSGAGTCTDAISGIIESPENTLKASATMDRDTIASQASKISDTVYAFPSELFVAESSGDNMFAESFDGTWKVSLDPASAEAVKQIEESKK